MKLSTAILVGGKSSRMNYENKSFLRIGHQTFIEHLIEVCASFDEVMLCGNNTQSYSQFDVRLVRDEVFNCGPLGGLYTVLLASEHDYVFVCATDMPFLNEAVIRYLMSYCSTDFDAFVLSDGNRVHPLCAIYHKSALPTIKSQLDLNRLKLKDLLQCLHVKVIDLNYSCFSHQVLENVNTPTDYKRVKKPFVFCVSGVKNSGKTTLVTKLIPRFKSLGYSIGTIKHDGHDFDIDVQMTDSAKHRLAGSDATIVYSNSQFAFMKSVASVSIETLIDYLFDCDIVIIEGLKHERFLKVEIVRHLNSCECVCETSTLIAIASNIENFTHESVEVIDLDDVDLIATRVLERMKRR